ncbi:hypothetical protein MBLNU230_g2063t1 [Neophaeotheca triangularis]
MPKFGYKLVSKVTNMSQRVGWSTRTMSTAEMSGKPTDKNAEQQSLTQSLVERESSTLTVSAKDNGVQPADRNAEERSLERAVSNGSLPGRKDRPVKLAGCRAVEAVEVVAKEVEAALTVAWEDLPPWQRDNHYIYAGYRPASNSYRGCFNSLGYLHNETVNIYTHLVGALLAALAGTVLYGVVKPRYGQATREDVLVLGCYFFGAVACLGMSATYHAISNHSDEVARFGNKLDYLGIVVLIWGSFIPSIYYGFAAEPALIRAYWTMITTVGAATIVVVLYPKFRTPEWRPVRALMFVAMGLSAIIPVVHGISIYGVSRLEKQIGLSWLVMQGLLYISGAVIYAARVPERLRPGAFDIWGSSHQVFHVLVVLAAAAHLVGLLKAFDYEHGNRLHMMAAPA